MKDLALHEAGAKAHDVLEHHLPSTRPAQTWPALLDDKDLEGRFERFVNERNWIMHRCSFDLEMDVPDQTSEIGVRLEHFADEARELSQYLISLIERRLSGRGLTPSEIQTQTKRVIDSWAAA